LAQLGSFFFLFFSEVFGIHPSFLISFSPIFFGVLFRFLPFLALFAITTGVKPLEVASSFFFSVVPFPRLVWLVGVWNVR